MKMDDFLKAKMRQIEDFKSYWRELGQLKDSQEKQAYSEDLSLTEWEEYFREFVSEIRPVITR